MSSQTDMKALAEQKIRLEVELDVERSTASQAASELASRIKELEKRVKDFEVKKRLSAVKHHVQHPRLAVAAASSDFSLRAENLELQREIAAKDAVIAKRDAEISRQLDRMRLFRDQFISNIQEIDGDLATGTEASVSTSQAWGTQEREGLFNHTGKSSGLRFASVPSTLQDHSPSLHHKDSPSFLQAVSLEETTSRQHRALPDLTLTESGDYRHHRPSPRTLGYGSRDHDELPTNSSNPTQPEREEHRDDGRSSLPNNSRMGFLRCNDPEHDEYSAVSPSIDAAADTDTGGIMLSPVVTPTKIAANATLGSGTPLVETAPIKATAAAVPEVLPSGQTLPNATAITAPVIPASSSRAMQVKPVAENNPVPSLPASESTPAKLSAGTAPAPSLPVRTAAVITPVPSISTTESTPARVSARANPASYAQAVQKKPVRQLGPNVRMPFAQSAPTHGESSAGNRTEQQSREGPQGHGISQKPNKFVFRKPGTEDQSSREHGDCGGREDRGGRGDRGDRGGRGNRGGHKDRGGRGDSRSSIGKRCQLLDKRSMIR